MIQDPIVAEVRAVREKLAAECGFDIRRIIDEARRRQQQSRARVVSFQGQGAPETVNVPPSTQARANVG